MKTIFVVEGVCKKLNEMNAFISKEKTGNADDLAIRLRLPLGTFKNFLKCNRELLSEFGVTIIYDRQRKTYRFSEPGKFKVGIKKEWEKLG